MGSPALHDFDAAVVLRHPALGLADDGQGVIPIQLQFFQIVL